MEQFVNKKISFFKNIFDNVPKNVFLNEVLASIKDETYKEVIDKCRYAIRENNIELYNRLKATIPAVTFSGEFGTRRVKDDLKSYSNFIILDFDKIERLNLFEDQIKDDPYVYAKWLSPSGTGYKVLIKVNCKPEEHSQAFDALVDYFDNTYKYSVDISGSDTSRLCILSFDPFLNINLDSKEWIELKNNEDEFSIDLSYSGNKKSKESSLIRRIVRFLKNRNLSITENYEQWYKVAYALSTTFSHDQGLKMFLELCRLDGSRHSEEKSFYIFEYCFRNNKRKITFSTLLYYAKEKGFIL